MLTQLDMQSDEAAMLQGAVLVTLKHAKNVPAADPNGLSDPYAILKLNNKTEKSVAQLRTLDPVWEEKYTWTHVSHALLSLVILTCFE